MLFIFPLHISMVSNVSTIYNFSRMTDNLPLCLHIDGGWCGLTDIWTLLMHYKVHQNYDMKKYTRSHLNKATQIVRSCLFPVNHKLSYDNMVNELYQWWEVDNLAIYYIFQNNFLILVYGAYLIYMIINQNTLIFFWHVMCQVWGSQQPFL